MQYFIQNFCKPITLLHEKSVEIEKGDLSARADLKRDDEIGELAAAFNRWRILVQDKNVTLEYHRELMEQELDMASNAGGNFPHITNNSSLTFQYSAGQLKGEW